MVLSEEEVQTRFLLLQIDTGGSGYQDNQAAAGDTINPSDTAEDLASQGRLDGYKHDFIDPGGLFVISSSVDRFDTPGSAQTFVKRQIDDIRQLKGKEIEEGVILKEFQDLDPPSVGSDAVAARLTASIVALGSVVRVAVVSWRRGSVVASVGIVGFDAVDRSAAAGRLARRMDRRIAREHAVEISATAIVPPTPTPVPTATPHLPPEEAARREGFDLPSMLLTPEDLPDGATIESEGFKESEAVSSYNREFEPEDLVMNVGSSVISDINITVDLYASAADAVRPVSVFKAVDPKVFGQLVGPAVAEGAGFTPENLEIERLELPSIGDAAAGFLMTIETADVGFVGYLLFFAKGRIGAKVFVFGPGGGVALEDVVPLAQLVEERIAKGSP